jgi:hypothetical protein
VENKPEEAYIPEIWETEEEKVLENGIFFEKSPDYIGRKKIVSASKFESICKVNGKLYKVIITTRKAKYDIDKLRYFSLKDYETAQNKKP